MNVNVCSVFMGSSVIEVQLRKRTEMCAESVHLTNTVRIQSGGSEKKYLCIIYEK